MFAAAALFARFAVDCAEPPNAVNPMTDWTIIPEVSNPSGISKIWIRSDDDADPDRLARILPVPDAFVEVKHVVAQLTPSLQVESVPPDRASAQVPDTPALFVMEVVVRPTEPDTDTATT